MDYKVLVVCVARGAQTAETARPLSNSTQRPHRQLQMMMMMMMMVVMMMVMMMAMMMVVMTMMTDNNDHDVSMTVLILRGLIGIALTLK